MTPVSRLGISDQVGQLHPLELKVTQLLCDEGLDSKLIVDVVLATRVALVGHAMDKAHLKLSHAELASLRERAQRGGSIEELTRDFIEVREVECTLGFKLSPAQHRRVLNARQDRRSIPEIAAAILRQPAYEATVRRILIRLTEVDRAKIWALNLRQLSAEEVEQNFRR
jgi:hypothetical protein